MFASNADVILARLHTLGSGVVVKGPGPGAAVGSQVYIREESPESYILTTAGEGKTRELIQQDRERCFLSMLPALRKASKKAKGGFFPASAVFNLLKETVRHNYNARAPDKVSRVLAAQPNTIEAQAGATELVFKLKGEMGLATLPPRQGLRKFGSRTYAVFLAGRTQIVQNQNGLQATSGFSNLIVHDRSQPWAYGDVL